jgi:hypothetical protein
MLSKKIRVKITLINSRVEFKKKTFYRRKSNKIKRKKIKFETKIK